MNECPNVWADTAFMPVKDILTLKDAGLLGRVLWGSDYPVMRYFSRIPARQYYKRRIKAAVKALGIDGFTKITRLNFSGL